MEAEMEIIQASYAIEDNQPVIELFGRCRDGSSAVVLYYGFRPYCYFEHNEISTKKILREMKGKITGHEEVELEHMLTKKKFIKIYTRLPLDVRTIRNKYDKETTFMSADILFPMRFIYDYDLAHYVKVSGDEVQMDRYKVDRVIRAESIESTEAFKQDLSILSFDIETSLERNEILTISIWAETQDGEPIKHQIVGKEKEILKEFAERVTEIDPDIITGYNIIFYDLPKIDERAKKHKLKINIGRDGSAMWSRKDRTSGRVFYEINGRVIADAWLHTKLIKRPQRETLDYVAQKYLGETKLDVNPKAIDEEWEKDPLQVMEYCLKDSELALRILKYIKVVDKNIALSTVANLSLTVAFENRTSALADSLLIRMADQQGVAVPCTHKGFSEGKIKGAYVRDPDPGVYKWVMVLDFKSMYPAIMMKNNLCLTTYAPGIGEIETPIGAHFLSKDIREGMVPRIMQKLQDDRQVCKDELKKAKKNQEPQNVIDFWDDLQYSVKVLANSFYGLFTSAFYRFTNRDIGSSITAFARENIKHVIEDLEADGYEVIYSDTDSVFFLSPFDNLEESRDLGLQISERFSKGGYELEFEKIMNRWFTHGVKKRYYGHVVWPSEEDYVRGYELRRRDSFSALTNTLKKMFILIMEDKSSEAVKLAREKIQEVKTGKVSLDELVISKSAKPEDEYADPDSQAQVRCARKLRDMGHAIAPYMSVSWIVTNSRKTPQQVEPFVSKELFTRTPDWDYYAERLARSLGRVTEVFGWDEERLYTGTQQTGLGRWSEE